MTRAIPRFTRIASASALALALAAPLALAPVFTTPAHAFFGGFGRIVYDPTNHAENLLTAARTLEQINNQITSLQNEAQMLINQARNLASLPHSSLQALQQNVQRTQQLLGQWEFGLLAAGQFQHVAFTTGDQIVGREGGDRGPAAHDEAHHPLGLDGIEAEVARKRGDRGPRAFQRADGIALDRAP